MLYIYIYVHVYVNDDLCIMRLLYHYLQIKKMSKKKYANSFESHITREDGNTAFARTQSVRFSNVPEYKLSIVYTQKFWISNHALKITQRCDLKIQNTQNLCEHLPPRF